MYTLSLSAIKGVPFVMCGSILLFWFIIFNIITIIINQYYNI